MQAVRPRKLRVRALGTTLLSAIQSTVLLVKFSTMGRKAEEVEFKLKFNRTFVILSRVTKTETKKAWGVEMFVTTKGVTTITFLGTPRRVTLKEMFYLAVFLDE